MPGDVFGERACLRIKLPQKTVQLRQSERDSVLIYWSTWIQLYLKAICLWTFHLLKSINSFIFYFKVILN